MPSVGAVTSNLNITTRTAAYTAKANDFVLADATTGAVTITLPASPTLNSIVAIKKTDTTSSAVSVVPNGSALIDGDTVAILAASGSAMTVQFDGTNWRLLSTGVVNTSNGIAGVPGGGTSGQILAKNSASDFDVKWATASAGGGGNFPTWVGAGRVFNQPYNTNNAASTSSWGYSYSFLQWYPLQIPNACTLTGIYVWAGSTASSSTVGIGLYADSPTATSGGPAARLVSTTMAVSTANNLVGSTVSYTFTAPQLVWVACGASTTTYLWSVLATAQIASVTLGSAAFMNSSGNGGPYAANNQPNMRYTTSYAYNSMPADASTTATTVYAGYNPLVLFTVA